MSWADFIQLGTFSAAVAACFIAAMNWFRESATRISSAKYLAMRIATSLERFSADCLYNYWDNNEGPGGTSIANLSGLPNLDFPVDESWKYLDVRLADEALTLQTEVHARRRRVNFSLHFENDPSELSDGLIEVGMRALRVAQRLRKSNGLPSIKLLDEEALEREHQALKDRRQAWAVRLAAMPKP